MGSINEYLCSLVPADQAIIDLPALSMVPSGFGGPPGLNGRSMMATFQVRKVDDAALMSGRRAGYVSRLSSNCILIFQHLPSSLRKRPAQAQAICLIHILYNL